MNSIGPRDGSGPSCITLISDNINNLYGSIRVVVLLGKAFKALGYRVRIIAPHISGQAYSQLKGLGFEVVEVGLDLGILGRLRNKYFRELATWLIHSRAAGQLIHVNEDCISINMSYQLPVPSTVYYALGHVSDLLADMSRQYPYLYLLYLLTEPVIQYVEAPYNRALASSNIVAAISRFVASRLVKRGIRYDAVVYPPIDVELFKPPVKAPEANYALAYIGKEVEVDTIIKIADRGVRIIVFGSKPFRLPKRLVEHPNVTYLGEVSDSELVRLYGNAAFTIFPHTHEPLGLVPLESMACGTPVLTYAKQGPAETVIHNEAGWLANSKAELINYAVKLWHLGYPEEFRVNARRRALEFGIGNIIREWVRLLAPFGISVEKALKIQAVK